MKLPVNAALGKLRSISLRALPSMGAVPMKNSLNNAEDRRAAQRAARRERRKANARASPAAEGEAAAEGDAAAAEGDAAAAAADPAPASLLPALIDKGAAGRKSPAAAAQALVLNENSKSKFDLYSLQTKSELQKADDEQEQKKKRLQAVRFRPFLGSCFGLGLAAHFRLVLGPCFGSLTARWNFGADDRAAEDLAEGEGEGEAREARSEGPDAAGEGHAGGCRERHGWGERRWWW